MSLRDVWMFFSGVVLALVRVSVLNYCLIYVCVSLSLSVPGSLSEGEFWDSLRFVLLQAVLLGL